MTVAYIPGMSLLRVTAWLQAFSKFSLSYLLLKMSISCLSIFPESGDIESTFAMFSCLSNLPATPTSK
ncbi:hypothetical protein VCRA2110O2_30038 [Vibrio crassostreae]|nr:hypothetical protein VCRA2110O2_30038 [Vibrio crassostreae]